MAIKTIKYEVNVTGITPMTEQFGGTQGDHRVAQIEFTLADELRLDSEKIMYRFDVYDGEGGIWSSAPTALKGNSVCLELEECHTRFGGKITVYLVITALSADNETQVELYSFPARLRLNNRPQGIYRDGETYESITSLAETAKINAVAAENSNQELQNFAALIEEKLKNGEFDGLGIETAKIVDNELIITYTDGTVQNLGNVKGDKGDIGPQGEKGETGKIGTDKTASGMFLTIAEEGVLANVNFTSTAPQNTKVRIYNENCVDENYLVGELIENVEFDDTAIMFNLVNVDEMYGPQKNSITNGGEFVFYGSNYLESYIEIDAPSFQYYIPLQNMVEGDTYKFICIVNSEVSGVDMDSNATNWNIIFDKTYLLNKDKSVVETVKGDGSISTTNIKPYTLAHFENISDLANVEHVLNLTYTVSDFVTKGYVDTLVGDIETLLGGI